MRAAATVNPSSGRSVSDDRAAGRRRQVEAGPAATGADVEQPVTRTQAEAIGEIVGLGDRRVPVRTPIGADHASFDLSDHVDALLPIAAGEAVACLVLVRDDHRRSGHTLRGADGEPLSGLRTRKA